MSTNELYMLPMVTHVNLSEKTVEARAYQLEALNEILTNSMMLVLPTAAGKTAVAWMATAEKLTKNDGWILMVAPTVALVNQHLQGMVKMIESKDQPPISITGQNPQKTRLKLWQSSRIIIATPQVARNDIKNGILDISNCSMMIVDEAHHSTGNHAMAELGEMYNSNSDYGLVLAMTASPGHTISKVAEICKRLSINRIHLRSSEDHMLTGYLSNLEIQEIKVIVPEEIHNMANPLKIWQQGIVDQERRKGRYIMPGEINHIGLTTAMERAQTAIKRGDKTAFISVSQIAVAMRLHHLINHLLCQGTAASGEFLNRMKMNLDNKSIRMFMRDLRIQNLISNIQQRDEIHSKISAVRRLVRERLRRNPNSRIIIFANYRDTIKVLEVALNDLKGARAIKFVGQSKRIGEEGMNPKKQIEKLEEFKNGNSNILLSTSVGEEGLDIPSADLVIFYEPVSSETRTIQRRGRTGRHREGEVIVLVAEGTRDEGASIAALRREMNMKKAVQRVKRTLPNLNNINRTKLDNFSINDSGIVMTSEEFIDRERAIRQPKVSEFDQTKLNSRSSERKIINFKSKEQKGLNDY